MKITNEIILGDYNKLKHLGALFFNKKKYSVAVSFVMKAALLMYESNIFYKDDELEYLMLAFGQKLIRQRLLYSNKTDKKKVVFYDYFVLNNRGLTEQYIEALASSNFEVLYIGCRKDDTFSDEIYSKIRNYDNFKVVSVSLNLDMLQTFYDMMFNFSPDMIIAHTAPWDVYGLTIISLFQNCKKYLINITDHAFWLGHTVFDYYFEFRDYGYNISKSYRNIPASKLLKLPYYPIVNEEIPFKGFNFNIVNKKIVFSGGSIYKIEGSPVFFQMVKYILDNHDDVIFLFLGNGNIEYIKNFIISNHYETRFFVFPERKDIYHVFKHSYLYLNTYPLIGGLMTQFACMAGIPPITLQKTTTDYSSDITELFTKCTKFPLNFSDKDELLKYVDIYLNNFDLYKKCCEELPNLIISKDSFNKLFLSYLGDSKNQLDTKTYDIDIISFAKDYITRFNENYCIKYYRLFVGRNRYLMFYFFSYICKYILYKILFIIRTKWCKYITGFKL